MVLLRSLLASLVAIGATSSFAQNAPDSTALEAVIVERYYVADSSDAGDEDGSAQLVPGSVTYRVFLDMKDGYEFQYLGGFIGHAITFNTTTSFFNNEDRGETWADAINDIHLDKNTVAIDSWLAVGAASDAHWGVLKADDPDGAQEGVMFPNDGGSNGIAEGLLTNDDPFAGIPLTEADGVMAADSAPPASTSLGDFPECFNTSGSSFSSENFGLAVLGSVPCPTPGNRTLIGQFTTDGVFSFCLNVWLRIPDSLVCDECLSRIEYYPSLNASDTTGLEGDYRFGFAPLCWSSDLQTADCLGVPGGPALPGTACDDGNPDSANDIWQEDCVCEGSVGIAENLSALVSIYPNPVNDLLRIRLEQATGEAVSISLRNAIGDRLMQRSFGRVSGTRTELLDLSTLAGGLYFLEVTVGTSVHVQRITKF